MIFSARFYASLSYENDFLLSAAAALLAAGELCGCECVAGIRGAVAGECRAGGERGGSAAFA